MKKLLLIGCVLLVAVVTGVLLYMAHIRSPKYALWQAKKAFEEHYAASFEKFVDVEGLVDNVIDDVLELGMEKRKPTVDREGLGDPIAKGLVTAIKPLIIKIAKNEIFDLIETGEFEKEEEAESEKPRFLLSQLWQNAKGDHSTFEGIAYEKQEAKIAYLGLIFRTDKRNTPLIVNLKMRDLGSHWQLADVTNAKEIFDTVDNAEVLEGLYLFEKEKGIDPGNRHISLLEGLISGEFVDNKSAGRLFVIKGKLRNDYPGVRNFIRVKGFLYLKDARRF